MAIEFLGICFNFNGVLPGNQTVKFLFLAYSVSFTKIIIISMPHRLNVFFLAFS